MHELPLLINIAVALIVAFLGGLVTRRIGLPTIIGYLLAGILIGPFTPGFVGDTDTISQLAELGVIFLMFGVGLHFSFADLWRVRDIAVPGALARMVLATLLGFGLTRLWGWSVPAGIVLGLTISIASTVVLLRGLMDNSLLNTPHGQVAVGWVVMEDLATVLILVLLPALAGPVRRAGLGQPGPDARQGSRLRAARAIRGHAADPLAALSHRPHPLARAVHPGDPRHRPGHCPRLSRAFRRIAGPRRLRRRRGRQRVAAQPPGRRGSAALSGKLSRRSSSSPSACSSTRSTFSRTSVPSWPWPSLIVIGRSLITLAAWSLLLAACAHALVVAAGLSQIGEFSFILGQAGLALGLLTQEQYSLILAGALISITVNPLMFRLIGPVEQGAAAHAGALGQRWIARHRRQHRSRKRSATISWSSAMAAWAAISSASRAIWTFRTW